MIQEIRRVDLGRGIATRRRRAIEFALAAAGVIALATAWSAAPTATVGVAVVASVAMLECRFRIEQSALSSEIRNMHSAHDKQLAYLLHEQLYAAKLLQLNASLSKLLAETGHAAIAEGSRRSETPDRAGDRQAGEPEVGEPRDPEAKA